MKPFRRTQVITLMAACAISTAWGQQNAGTPQAAAVPPSAVAPQIAGGQQESATPQAWIVDGQWLDQDVRDRIEAARKYAEDARAYAVDAKEWQVFAGDTLRAVQDGVWPHLDDSVMAKIDGARMKMLLAQEATPKPALAPMPPMPPMRPLKFNFDSGSGSYESGKSALDNHYYEKAVEIFDRVINARTPSTRADGAYYWKAYALNKLGKRDEALAALAELAKQFPQSSWLNDAKALQAEVQQGKGQPISPENQADEDLKLYAINALINSDAERAVPLLEGLLSNPKMSPRLKERALFVLAQSRSDKAHDIVGRYAKGGSNPDLQLTAVQYLGSYRSKESRQLLSEVYGSVNDVNVKRAVLRSFENSRDIDHLTAIAKSEQNVDLRREAIRQLGNIRDDQTTATLVSLYGAESDREIKREILNSLRSQGAAKQIIECARKESDPELKRDAVRMLSEMRSKEAMDYLMEILK
jgi:tetratricopeptide (TPR) repeat protein